MHHQPLSGQWNFRQYAAADWMPATVPGGVHTDLLALGKIPDPFVAALARFVELDFDEVDVVFSDNYFDVSPNQAVTVTAPVPEDWTAEQARKGLRVRSLVDSY